jgi:hypothetical protein
VHFLGMEKKCFLQKWYFFNTPFKRACKIIPWASWSISNFQIFDFSFLTKNICSISLASDIVYAWANLLNDAFKYISMTPTRSQMLGAAYPESVIRKFGEAKIFMLLDATEIQAKIASLKLFNSALYSAYSTT